ncbi:hypothetical protein diail_2883 [Diaporthe ilicicola]|nr:hypothetical protein diail_2883 [Diaporthe ilicicola]
MTMEHAETLNTVGWLKVFSRATAITFNLGYKASKAVLTRKTNGLSLHEYVAYVGMREYQSGLSAVAIQNLLPSTAKNCARYAKKHSIPCETVRLPDGTAAIRFGPAKAKKTVVFFHGGGYMAPALSEHMSFALGYGVFSMEDTAIYILQHDLASENANHYPRQLHQAVSLMHFLIVSEKIRPELITLVGDSAGAHLLLSLLLHLKRPNPQVPELQIHGILSGAVLVSPWVDLQSSCPSVESNKQNDLLSASSLEYWAKNFLGGAAADPWNSPFTAPPEWWIDLPVKKILLTYGERELLRDDAVQLSEMLQKCHAGTTVMNFPGELHVHMIMNRFLRIRGPCESEKAYVKWLSDHIKGVHAEDGPPKMTGISQAS